jgi:hypothetical protein
VPANDGTALYLFTSNKQHHKGPVGAEAQGRTFLATLSETGQQIRWISRLGGLEIGLGFWEGLCLVTLVYLGLSLFCGVSAMLHYSIITGLTIWGASALAPMAAGYTVLGALSHGATYKVGSVLLGLALLVLTYWLSTKFSIGLSGANVSGLTWCLFGCAVGAFWGFNSRPEGKHS